MDAELGDQTAAAGNLHAITGTGAKSLVEGGAHLVSGDELADALGEQDAHRTCVELVHQLQQFDKVFFGGVAVAGAVLDPFVPLQIGLSPGHDDVEIGAGLVRELERRQVAPATGLGGEPLLAADATKNVVARLRPEAMEREMRAVEALLGLRAAFTLGLMDLAERRLPARRQDVARGNRFLRARRRRRGRVGQVARRDHIAAADLDPTIARIRGRDPDLEMARLVRPVGAEQLVGPVDLGGDPAGIGRGPDRGDRRADGGRDETAVHPLERPRRPDDRRPQHERSSRQPGAPHDQGLQSDRPTDQLDLSTSSPSSRSAIVHVVNGAGSRKRRITLPVMRATLLS